MRSLSSREKMSQPRSPRWVCSTTVGTSAGRGYLGRISDHRVSGRGQPRDQRRPREPPGRARASARQLAGLGELDHDRLVDLQELRRPARRSSPPAGRTAGTSTTRASAPARRGRRVTLRGRQRAQRAQPAPAVGVDVVRDQARRPGPSCESPAPRRRGRACRPRSPAAGRRARSRPVSSWTYPERYLKISRRQARRNRPRVQRPAD